MKSVECKAVVPYETKGGYGLLVRDDVVFNSARDTKVSAPLALAAGSSDLLVLGRNLQISRKGAVNCDLATVIRRFETQPTGVCSASTRNRRTLS